MSNRSKKMTRARLEQLSAPRPLSPAFVPDKISVYWLDYVLDETPRKLTNPHDLHAYYRNCRQCFPRTEKLAEARPSTSQNDSRPRTAYGIPVSALTYSASERIKRLATPVERQEEDGQPRTAFRALTALSEKYNWYNQTADLFSIGDFQSRSRITQRQRRSGGNGSNGQPSNEYQYVDRTSNSAPGNVSIKLSQQKEGVGKKSRTNNAHRIPTRVVSHQQRFQNKSE